MTLGAVPHPVVVPRVSFAPGGAAQPLERIVRGMIASAARELVFLRAPSGGGKSTALAYLRQTLCPESPVDLLDAPTDAQVPESAKRLTIVARAEPPIRNWLTHLYLVPWCEDDWIEYCAAAHREQLAWILARLRADENRSELEGSPRLWRAALDELAADEKLPDAAAALRARLRKITTPSERRDLADLCAWTLVSGGRPPQSEYPKLPLDARALSQHYAFRMIVAASSMVEKIAAHTEGNLLARMLAPELIRHIGAEIRHSAPATQRLEQLLTRRRKKPSEAMAASILLAANPMWHIKAAVSRRLDHASLAHAQWPGVVLQQSHLSQADLHGADLSGADLTFIIGVGANFHGTNLVKAKLDDALLVRAHLASANLCDARAHRANCEEADFSRANLRSADFFKAKFYKANLAGAQLLNTNLTNAELVQINVEDADFIGTYLKGASFNLVHLSSARFTNVSFATTSMFACNLEGMHLPGADFSYASLVGSFFTGSFMPRACFYGANLSNTGLAEIEWENANLRDADLRGATFHMGSSRSGLVGSVIPCEGSKTGFYTDDYLDQDYKPAEEIRKANLRGADLRGAKIDDVDFYLVDLRDAKYTPEQAKHLAATGAILHAGAS